jgi:hypothetical protein
MQMLESGLGSVPAAVERGVQVCDLAELLDKSIAYSKPAAKNGPDGQAGPPGGDGVAAQPVAGASGASEASAEPAESGESPTV